MPQKLNDEMQFAHIPLDAIERTDRARKNLPDIEELASSITANGLITPICVMRFDDRDKYRLIAGERRIEAHIRLEKPTIAAYIYPQIEDLQFYNMELHENTQRTAFTWAEETALRARIHKLHIAKYGEKVATTKGTPEQVGWSISDTADLLGKARSTVSTDINLQEAIEADASLAKFKTREEAIKQLKLNQEQIVAKEILRRAQERAKSDPESDYNALQKSFVLSDVFDGLAKQKSNSVDIVELDPPYAIQLQQMKGSTGPSQLSEYNEIEAEEYPEFMMRVFKECYRIMKNNSWMILWYAIDPWIEVLPDILREIGFDFSLTPAIWVKPAGQTRVPEKYLAATYEAFLYVRKGAPTIHQQGHSIVFPYKPVPDMSKIHPTERPLNLMLDILDTFTTPGAHVLVPFAGSGKTLIAAHKMQMTSIGFDISKEFQAKYSILVEKYFKYKSLSEE